MNYTQGPWSIQIKPKTLERQVGLLRILSIDNDTGPVVIVDRFDTLVAAVVHRPGRAEGFSETAGNARLIAHAPDVYEKAVALVRALREGEGSSLALTQLEDLLKNIEGKSVVPSP